MKDVEIYIKEGSKPEVYTEEHEKLLGDSKTTWTLLVDGYDVEGERIYDQYLGKSCHQCRYSTQSFLLFFPSDYFFLLQNGKFELKG